MQAYKTVLMELKRKGDLEKVKWLEGMNKRITKSQKQRIIENDNEVMQELFAPKWVSWDLIYSWATEGLEKKNCVLCGKKDSLGMDFKGKFMCSGCFIELKHKI